MGSRRSIAYEIPSREELEPWYEKWELEELDAARRALRPHSDPRIRAEIGRQALRTLWPDELTYISKTSWIATKDRGLIRFDPNYAQRRFYKDVIQFCREEKRPIRAVVLKARQLGFSTFIQLWQFEQVARERHRFALTVSFDDKSTLLMFQKAKLVLQRSWFPMELSIEASDTIEFAEPHGSAFYTRTAGNENSGRSQTVHHLHCSETPMWENAEAVWLGLSNAVPVKYVHSSIFHESTARGAVGLFYQKWQRAVRGESDEIPFFAPWYWDQEYQLEFKTDDHKQLFLQRLPRAEEEFMRQHKLTPEQMHWRAWKIRNELEGSVRKFQQEYPSDAEEAFLTTGSPVFNPEAVRELAHNAAPPLWKGDVILTPQEA